MSEWLETFGEWATDEVQVETALGAGAYGQEFEQPVTADELMVRNVRQLVLNSEGDEVVASATIMGDLRHKPTFALHSRVTLGDGRRGRVLAVTEELHVLPHLEVTVG